MRWTPERIAEFEAACAVRQLRRENPMPGPIRFDSAVEVVRHALLAFRSGSDNELTCDAWIAAITAVQALQGAGLLASVTRQSNPTRKGTRA